MKKTFIIALLFLLVVFSMNGDAQTRRRGTARRNAGAAKAAADKSSADVKAGAAQVAAQVKTLTHFVYLLGGIVKGIESVDQAISKNEASPAAREQNERNKGKVREGIRSVREGLSRLAESTILERYV